MPAENSAAERTSGSHRFPAVNPPTGLVSSSRWRRPGGKARAGFEGHDPEAVSAILPDRQPGEAMEAGAVEPQADAGQISLTPDLRRLRAGPTACQGTSGMPAAPGCGRAP